MLFFFFFEGFKLSRVCVSGAVRQDRGREQANSNTELSITSNVGLLEDVARARRQGTLLF